MVFSRIGLGSARLRSLKSTAEIIQYAANTGVNYIDCCPYYSYISDDNNSEIWIGKSLKNCLKKIMLSNKSRPVRDDGEEGPNLVTAEGIESESDVKRIVEQSLKRMGVQKFEWYQLWNINSIDEFNIAKKNGGWLTAIRDLQKDGIIEHVGISSHGDSETIINFLNSYDFEMVTVPFNLLDTSRIKVLEFASSRNIQVMAMNPLAGGLLTGYREEIVNEFSDIGISSITELALAFILAEKHVVPLVGVSSVEELIDGFRIASSDIPLRIDKEEIIYRFNKLTCSNDKFCTSCGYCGACPKGIDIGKNLKFYSYYNMLDSKASLNTYYDLWSDRHWEIGYNIEDCTGCGLCEKKCPNKIPIRQQLGVLKKSLNL